MNHWTGTYSKTLYLESNFTKINENEPLFLMVRRLTTPLKSTYTFLYPESVMDLYIDTMMNPPH